MDRINSADFVDIGGGKRGFRNENLETGVAGTVVDAAWLNGAQEELMAIIEGAGDVADPANWFQVAHALQGGKLNYAIAAGTANALAVTLALPPAALIDGMPFRVKISAANTGPATFDVNGLGPRAIIDLDGNALVGGELLAGQIRQFFYHAALDKVVVAMMPRPATVAEVEAGLRNDVYVSPLTKWTARQAYFNARQTGTMTLASGVVSKVTNLTTMAGSYFSDAGSSYAAAAFTCGPKDAGVWLIGGYLAVPVGAAATIRNYIGINGVTTSFQSTYAPGSGTLGVVQARMLKIAAGDSIDIRAFQNSGSPIEIGGEFFGVRIAN